ncbi:5' nucleotidase, NT5C type [Hydrogenophaga sp. NFH-34]|uniref:5' nucleotidase, NT5C type n=1 Tax=Hydrogenophaga sp. NFH-34 TaxID=2744446 RepID=UPI001F304CF8|nr:hypothetical protein [Hydrogenophaga sp. NFH-34]
MESNRHELALDLTDQGNIVHVLEDLGYFQTAKQYFNRNRQDSVRVFIDMDGVTVDFDGYMAKNGLGPDEVKKMPGAYRVMEPIDGALEAIRELIALGFEVWMATKPPTGIAHAYSDKAAWVFEHIPELSQRIIITHDKGLLGSEIDFLLDDRPHKANCLQFPGTLLQVEPGNALPAVLPFFKRLSEALKS